MTAAGRLREALLWGAVLALAVYRIATAGSDPSPLGWLQDMGTWNHGAKHWAIHGTWVWDDFAPQFVTPVHSWIAGMAFRTLGLGFRTVALVSCVQMLVILVLILAFYRDAPWRVRAGIALFFAFDATLNEMVGSGTNEYTMLLWLFLCFLVLSRAGTLLTWGAGGALFALAFLTKVQALIFAPALLLHAFWRGRRSSSLAPVWAFAAGFAAAAAPVFLFIWPHREAWLSTLLFFQHFGENYNRPAWMQVGAFLFNARTKIMSWENAFMPAVILAAPVWGLHLLRREERTPDVDRTHFYGWLAVCGFLGLALLPAYPRRAAMLVLPLAYLTARVLADPGGWGDLSRHLWSVRARWSLFTWAVVAFSLILSFFREAVLDLLAGRRMDYGMAEALAGYAALGVSIAVVPLAGVGLGRLLGLPRDGTRWLAAGAAALMGSFALLPAVGVLRRLLPAGSAATDLTGSCAAVAAAFAAGAAAVALLWRLSRNAPDALARVLAGLAVLCVAGGLSVRAKRIASGVPPGRDFEAVTRAIAADIPEGAVVLGDAAADALLVAARCKVVTPWAWLASEREKAAARVPYTWNDDPIARFAPTHLLATDEGLSGRGTFPERVAALEKCMVRRYDLRGRGASLFRLEERR